MFAPLDAARAGRYQNPSYRVRTRCFTKLLGQSCLEVFLGH